MATTQVLTTLIQARETVFATPGLLPQVARAVSDIANTSAALEVQQWCSQFFCDILSPEATTFSFLAKQDICPVVLPALLKLSDVPDVTVYKNVVLAATSLYEMVFDLVAKVSNAALWGQFTVLKNKIFTKWDSTHPLEPRNDDTDKFRSIGSKLAALKFIGRVVIVQSAPVVNADPRRRGTTGVDPNEISIANVNSAHAVLNKQQLDAEANGFFEILVRYFVREEFLVAQIAVAVLENLVFIIQRRKHLAPAVFSAIAAIDLDAKYQHASHKLLRYKLGRRYVERAIKNCLNYCMRAGISSVNDPHHGTFAKLVSEIDAKMVEQKRRGVLTKMVWDNPRKKMKVDPTNPFARDVLTVDDNSLTSMYQLIGDSDPLVNFDVEQIPAETLKNICIATIRNVDSKTLITALSIVSSRYTDLIMKTPGSGSASAQPSAKVEVKEEDMLKNDDEDNKQILQSETVEDDVGELNIDSTFVLPAPQKLNEEQKRKHLQLIIQNFFKLSKIPADDKSISSFNIQNKDTDTATKISQVAINDWGKNSWLVMLTRLATRGLHGEEEIELANQIREAIFQYFLEDVRDRVEIIIEWLNEEWFAEFTRNSKMKSKNDRTPVETPNYIQWAERVLDSMIPFLEADAKDRKVFIRLISDLPFLNAALVERIKSLCIDPLRSALGFQSLQFLIMFRPPVKRACIDILKELYSSNEDLKTTAFKLLDKFAPGEVEKPEEEKTEVSAA